MSSKISSSEDGVVVAEDIPVAARDGTVLMTDVYRPARDGQPVPGRFPAVLWRTSYDKSRAGFADPARYFCRRGYVAVVQDIRGRGKSEGFGQYYHVYNVHEGRDGYDTVEWTAAQPWSNGKVGTIGLSHGGIVQSAMALERPPHLAAMFISESSSNPYHSGMRQNGALELRYAGHIFLHAITSQEADIDPSVKAEIAENMTRFREWLARLPWRKGSSPYRSIPNLEKEFFEVYHRGDYDDFWKHRCINWEEYYDEYADVPTYYETGWYDSWPRAVIENYVALSKMKKGPLKLVVGSWVHGGAGRTYSGDAGFGPEAAIDYDGLALRWFDRWLKEIDNGVDEEPPVRLFIMGGGSGRKNADGRLEHGGRWRTEQHWPLGRTLYTPYYFYGDGSLSPEVPEADAPPLTYDFDPENPVPAISANVSGFGELLPVQEGAREEFVDVWSRFHSLVAQGASDQREGPDVFGCKPPYPRLSERPDVLVFQTPPLEEDVEVLGPITVKLWVSSSAKDTDFTAKLIDVHPPSDDYPQGYDMGLSDSIIRARYRNGWDHGELMTPGEVYGLQFTLYPVGNLFVAGHRIRVDISSSCFPHFDVNPNTGEPMGRHTHTVVARNTLYVDRQRPSHIVLSVIPLGPD